MHLSDEKNILPTSNAISNSKTDGDRSFISVGTNAMDKNFHVIPVSDD